jgi:hypothetical protein
MIQIPFKKYDFDPPLVELNYVDTEGHLKPTPVAHIIIPSYLHQKLRSGGLWSQAKLGKKVCKSPSQWKKPSMVARACHPTGHKCKIGGL